MWQKLQDKSLSWETRFKIAVCQWKRRDRLLRDNETTRMCILKWLTESVTNLHKSRIEHVYYWRLCADVLHSLSDERASVFITKSYFKVMAQVIEDDIQMSTLIVVTDCLSSILSLNPVPTVICKIEIMLPLVVVILKSTANDRSVIDSISRCLAQFLSHITHLLSVHGNAKKMYISICNSLLRPLLLLRGQVDDDDQSILCSAIFGLLQTLFIRDHLDQYLCIIAQDHAHSSSFKGGVYNYTSYLITELKSLFNNGDTKECVLVAIPLLLKAMINQNRIECQLSSKQQFQVYMLFVNIITLTATPCDSVKTTLTRLLEEGATDDSNSMEEQDGSIAIIECIHKCLVIMLKENIYQLSEDGDSEQFNQLIHVLSVATQYLSLHNTRVINNWYGILSVLLTLNYQLIIPYTTILWTLMFTIQHKQSSEMRTFSTSLVLLYSKLHQLPEVIKGLLDAINEIYQYHFIECSNRSLFVHEYLKKSLQASLATVPVRHCITIIKQFIDSLKDDYRPLWEGLPVTGKRRKKDAEDTPTSLPSEQLIPVINCIIDILAAVLYSISLDVFNKGETSDELVGVVNDLFNNVCVPLMKTANIKPILQVSALYLYLTVSKLIYSLRALYPQTVSGITGTSLSLVWERDSVIPCPKYWNRIDYPCSPILDILLRQLCLLSMRFGDDKDDINKMLEYLTVTSTSLQKDTWNGQVLSVTSINQCTAAWCLLLQELPVVSQYIINNDNVWRRIAVCIVQLIHISIGTSPQTSIGTSPQTSIGMSPQTSIGTSPQTSTGMETIVNDLLHSSQYLEMRFLHVQLLSVVVSQAGSVWPKEYRKDVKLVLSDSSTPSNIDDVLIKYNDVYWEVSQFSPTDKNIKKLTKFINFVPVCLKVIDSIPTCRSHVSHVTQIVRSLSSLFISVKIAITSLNYITVDSLINTLISFSGLFNRILSFDVARKGWPSLHVLLPWLLDVGVVAVKKDNTKLFMIALVAMEKLLEYQLRKGDYPIEFTKLVRKRSVSSNDDFVTACLNVIQHVSSVTLTDKTVPSSQCTDLQRFKKQLKKFEECNRTCELNPTIVSKYLSGCGLDEWTVLQSNLLSLLKDVPSFHEFMSNQQILYCYPSSINGHAPNRLRDHMFTAKWLVQLQRDQDNIGWEEFVGVARVASIMMKTIGHSQEDHLKDIFDAIMSQADDTICSKFCWLLSWLCVMQSDLKHNDRVILTKYITKVLIKTVHYVINVENSDSCCHGNNIVVTGLRLLELLAMLPTKVGLNPRTVVLLLHVFSGVTMETLSSQPLVLLGYQQLLLAVVFNHSTVLSNCSSLLLAPVIKCLQCNILLAQSSCHGNHTVQVLTSFTRLMEVLSQQAWFIQNAVYCIGQYLTSSDRAPMDKKLKISLQSSLLLLLKQLNDTDKNYLLSSLEEQGRTNLLSLFNDYNKYYKFKGRV